MGNLAQQIAKNRTQPGWALNNSPLVVPPDDANSDSDNPPIIQSSNIDGKGAPQVNLPDAQPQTTTTTEPPQPEQSSYSSSMPTYNPNAPKEYEARMKDIANRISGYNQIIQQNMKKADVLRTMPWTQKDGSTQTAWQAFATDADPTGEIARKQYTDGNGRFRSGLNAAIQSLASNPQLRNVRDWGDLARALTYSGGAAVGGAIHSSWDEEQKRAQAIQQLEDQNIKIQKQAKYESDLANVQTDNQRQQQELDDKRQSNHDKLQVTLRQNFYHNHRFFDPEHATDADKKELASFGETPESVGRYDMTRPNVKTFGGTVYQYNPNSSAWEPTDIPKDGSKEIVEYKVKDPNTDVEYTYATTSEKAASLKTSLIAMGLQIKVAESRVNYEASVDDKKGEDDYQKSLGDYEQKRSGFDATVTANQGRINDAYDEIKRLEDDTSKLNKVLDKEKISKNEDAIRSTRNKISDLNSENNKALKERDSLAKPVRPSKTPTYTPPISVQKFTSAEVRARQLKLTPDATETELQNAINKVRQQGYLVE